MSIRLSVVVPTFQRRDYVVAHVRSLADQTADPSSFEVIVVVDGSTDGTVEGLDALTTPFRLRVLTQPNCGLSATRNRGLAAAVGEIVLFIDDDMDPDPGLVAAHLRAHDDGGEVVLGAMPGHPDNSGNVLAHGVGLWGEKLADELALRPPRVDEIVGGHISVRRSVLDVVGGFDEGFTADGAYGGEDLEFGIRLVAGGYDIRFEPGAVTRQRYCVDAATFLSREQQSGHSDVAIVRRHPQRRQDMSAAKRSQSRWKRFTRLPATRIPGVAVVAGRLLDPIAIRRVDAGRADGATVRLIHLAAALRYWRGWREAFTAAGTVRILCYHAVADLARDRILADYGVPGAQFGRQLDALRRDGYTFVSMSELLCWLDGRATLPRRSVMITFDDGYVNVADAGLPELVARSVPAALFAVTGCTANVWDQEIGAGSLALLAPSRLREMAAAGVAIGSHTTTHAQLPKLDDERLEREFHRSADELARFVPGADFTMAYPHGEYDDRVVAAARTHEVRAGFTIDAKICRPGQDRHSIPRIEILRSDDGWRFRFKVLTADAAGRLQRSLRARARAVRRSIGRRLPSAPARDLRRQSSDSRSETR